LAREIVIGNGRLLVALDDCLRIRDFFYPRVGLENHLSGHPIRMGVWARDKFSWLGDGWEILSRYLPDTRVSVCNARNPEIGIELEVNDGVHSSLDVFLRKVIVRNPGQSTLEVRLFFAQDFHIYGIDTGDTALYHPGLKAIIHYKGQRYFLINGTTGRGSGIFQFATGIKESFGLEGSWKDAEDGELSGNPIAQGSVDSIVSFTLNVGPASEETLYYWIACGKRLEEAEELNAAVLKTGVEQLLIETENYWSAWVNRRILDLGQLPAEVARLFKSSLMMMRMHVDNGGGVIASCDSDVLKFSRDTYAYVWPRDGAIAALALDTAGFEEVTRLFFHFCDRAISKNGFFFHKYSTDGSQGSSWHSLVDSQGQPRLPIQEDETALVLVALWQHFQRYRDLEFIAGVYPNLVVRASDFLLAYIDQKTGLPQASFDIWEEKYGVFTATAATVYSALSAASNFAQVFFDRQRHRVMSEAAARLKQAMRTYLYDPQTGSFLKAVYPDGTKDRTADSSLSFIFDYGPFQVDDPQVAGTMKRLVERLWLPSVSGGMARYENDEYYRVVREVTGNPWFVCTLWLAKWRIAIASSVPELNEGLDLIMRTARSATSSGVLSEQVHPITGRPVSVSPLLWSHAEFVLTVYQYLKKYRSLVSNTEAGPT
jgi:GH15 family glucan-1,4-alpha-glucosidase